jgi:hypothetical protein
VRQLQGGARDDQVLARILGSLEFFNRAGSLAGGATADDRLVRAFYEQLLGRTSGEAEVAGWRNALPSQGRERVALGFLSSQEFRGRLVGAMYDDVLDRSPDDNGFRGWVGSGLDASRMREGFYGSAEFYDDERASAPGVTFDAQGRATLQGTSLNHDDKQFFILRPPQDGTLSVQVRTTSNHFAQLEIETSQGVEVFETEPKDGVNSGSVGVRAGTTYFVRLRSPDKAPAAFEVDLRLA